MSSFQKSAPGWSGSADPCLLALNADTGTQNSQSGLDIYSYKVLLGTYASISMRIYVIGEKPREHDTHTCGFLQGINLSEKSDIVR